MFLNEILCIIASHVQERQSAALLACTCRDWHRAVLLDREDQVEEVMRAMMTWIDPPRCTLKCNFLGATVGVAFQRGGFFRLQHTRGGIKFHHRAVADDGRSVAVWFHMAWRNSRVKILRTSKGAEILSTSLAALSSGRLIQSIEQTVRGGCKLTKQQ